MTADHGAGPADRRLPRLIAAMLVAGGAVGLSGLLDHQNPGPAKWELLAVLALFALAELPVLHVRYGRERYSFTWTEAVVVVGLVVMPHGWLRLVAPAGIALSHLLGRRAPIKIAFNAAAGAVGIFLARVVSESVGQAFGDPDLSHPGCWLALAAGSLTWFVWNNASVTAAVSLSQGTPFFTVYRKGFLLALLVWAGNTAFGIAAVGMAATNPALLVVFPPVILVLAALYRSYLRAMQERDVWETLQAASRELVQTERSELARVTTSRAASLFGADFAELVLVDGGEAVVHRWRQGATSTERGTPQEVAGAFWGRALCEQEPFELAVDTAPSPQRADLERWGLAACAVAPLMGHEGCLGTLRIGFQRPLRLRVRERQVLATFANHVSVAVNNVRLFDDIRHRALHDPLTGLPNRVLLLDRLEHALARSRRTPTQVAVLFFDLDRFKVINDSLGHQAGDRLLGVLAERLASVIRPGDTAVRFGGDEFVVVCEDVTGGEEALELAHRVAASLAEPVALDGHPVVVRTSVGVALAHPDGSDEPSSLIRDADAAMYRAKERGRGRCELFDADLHAQALARLEVEHDLRRAIDQGELRLHYQPVVDLEGQRTVGVEALVRWEHPGRGLVPPGEFVALAEETGLIGHLGRWVVREACRQLAAWRLAEQPPGPGFTVAVNLSPHELSDPGLVDAVLDALTAAGVPPSGLCLEITESAIVDVEGAVDTLRQLRELGVSVALDDFGTGYSSFAHLSTLPVDVLKIDQSFVGRLGGDTRDRAIVAGMVELAHALGLTVVAEGVETAGQLAELARLGCDSAQGYYLARPQPPAAAATSFAPAPDLADLL